MHLIAPIYAYIRKNILIRTEAEKVSPTGIPLDITHMQSEKRTSISTEIIHASG